MKKIISVSVILLMAWGWYYYTHIYSAPYMIPPSVVEKHQVSKELETENLVKEQEVDVYEKDPLVHLNQLIDWEDFRTSLKKVLLIRNTFNP